MEDVKYLIEEINNEFNYIIIKPYSDFFKKNLNEYPSYRIDASNILYADDPRVYLALFCKPIIDDILEKEKNYISEDFLKSFEGMENKTISVPNDDLSENKVIDVNYNNNSLNSSLNFIIS